ncbi:restriction endonuclease subunit S [Cnuella takakiae]|nr:restriction endonuclease subunit S [Cnuella takakiae]OLY94593.1 hypothetical protein BUE76_01430 [Cnuella takakiae]
MEAVMKKVRVEKYPAYKETGVEWLGEIPMHWQVQRGKWLFVKQERPVRPDDDIVTCFRDGQVTLRINRKTDGFTNALKEHGYQGIRKGDLVIHAMDAFAGAIGVSDSDGKSTPVYAACTPREEGKVDPYYYAYFLRSLAKNGFIESLAKGIRERSTDFRYSDFGELLLSLPPIEEQTAIAAFLDRKTAQVDKAIVQKEKLIELLQERRQILIHKAVTRGLNPDVRMKDSGVEWIGEIPEHWEILIMNYAFNAVADVDHYMPPTRESGVPYIMTGDLEEFASDINFESCKKVSRRDYLNLSKKIKSSMGDVILARYATIGTASYINIDFEFVVSYSCVTIKPNPSKLLGLYLFYYIKSDAFAIDIRNQINTNTQGNVGIGDLKKVKLVLPPINEQLEIVEKLQKEKEKFSKLIELQNQQIEKFREYKATLINAAVTGKIKVS